ncbi:MAG: triose-phosphate isomerase [Clostridiales bacterium]|nr:triose-phosphate isomerase [Clostridiales bacterium]
MNKKYRKAIIAGNWKMNLLPSQVKPYAEELRNLMPKSKTCEVALCVPFTHISTLRRSLKDNRIAIGAQDVSLYEKGAYTGEISAEMLADLNVNYVIVGHSECRQYHGDTDIDVGRKAAALLEKGMSPIICVGESLDQRERGLTVDHIRYQVLAAMSSIPEEKVRQCVIAYEPIWAIGTGKTATPEEAQEVCETIRAVIRSKSGARTARSVSILYGGSMNSSNAFELLSMPDIDGGLIGGASLKPSEFSKIIGAVAEVTGEEQK